MAYLELKGLGPVIVTMQVLWFGSLVPKYLSSVGVDPHLNNINPLALQGSKNIHNCIEIL